MSDLSCRNRKVFGKHTTSDLAFEKAVTIQTYCQDKYTRLLGDVILPDGTNVNQDLVKQGWCWWYRTYAPGDTVLERLEAEAREAKKGLWADPQPVPPWGVAEAQIDARNRARQDVWAWFFCEKIRHGMGGGIRFNSAALHMNFGGVPPGLTLLGNRRGKLFSCRTFPVTVPVTVPIRKESR